MEQIQQRRKITRNRELRACVECRKRKLKCDRQVPCAACSRRNEASACEYAGIPGRLNDERSRHLEAEARLKHLEQMIQALSSSQGSLSSLDGSPFDIASSQRGGEEIPRDALYNGATHWSAMLEDIEELRATIREPDHFDFEDFDFTTGRLDGINLLLGASKDLSFQQILDQFLPSRQGVDRSVAAYLRSKALAAPFIHAAQFKRLYQSFWDSPSSASPLWTSILFSILNIATRTLPTTCAGNGDEKSTETRFAVAAAHCLAFGEYYRPQKFAVEALLLFVQATCITSLDISPELGTIFGVLARLAMIMGYHKDADNNRTGISAFEGEMRRRTWSLCMQLDMLISFQLGLPSNFHFPNWDTKPPTNLLDSDFDEDTVQLPTGRPDSEPTELVFYIAKHKLMAVFGKIISHVQSVLDRPVDELETIDQELRATYAAIPIMLKPRPMMDSVVDPPSIIVTRLCVSFIYQKCLCVLHRKHVMRGRRSSIEICFESAFRLVRDFLDVYKEFGSGGQLETEQWFMSSLTWHDFLMGCAALCLTACTNSHRVTDTAIPGLLDISMLLRLLRQAQDVCKRQSARSKDTWKVGRLIQATINELSRQQSNGVPSSQVSLHHSEDIALTPHLTDLSSSQSINDWPWSDVSSGPLHETEWAYLGQFLDFPTTDSFTEFGDCGWAGQME